MKRTQMRRSRPLPGQQGLTAALRNQRGSVFLISLILVFVVSLLGVALFDLSTVEHRLVVGDRRDAKAFHVAEAGLYRGFLDLADGDGSNDFDSVFLGLVGTSLYTNQGFGGGGYTVTAVPVLLSFPNQITLTASGCFPAGTPCGAGHTLAVIRTQVNKLLLVGTAIFGNKSVSFGGAGWGSDSYDSSQGAYNAATAGNKGSITSNGTIDIQSNGVVNGSILSTTDVSGVDVKLSSNAIVTGNVTTAGTVLNQGTVSGTITQNSPSTPINYPPVNSCGPPYSLGIGMTGTYTYSPITGALKVSGGNTVTLATGTYCFQSVTLSGGSTLQVNGPVALYLTGQGDFGGGGLVNSTLKPENLQILSSYTGASHGITIGGGTQVYALVYAPKTEVVVSGNGNLYGAVVGDTVNSNGGAKIHYDEALGKSKLLKAGLPSFTMTSWQRCHNISCS
jgi:PilX N-terminal